ncbi:MAG TPA: Glu/Leu/Phe/Val dehydrogenase dimerization domain-containing protein [Novosphingobium sp.]|nr:Glu/Leu/Phe/Val dehydrogenase dimerization domain-containing protein [Novosphingobium sp.]
MAYLAEGAACPPERIQRISDPASGLEGVIVVHSTRLGPAAGGCRLWDYPSESAMIADAVRLAEGMSYKNALAGLPFGGGKAALRLPSGQFDRKELFRAFGRAVERLRGDYVTAEDVGTNVADMEEAGRFTRSVSGLTAKPGRPGGDPSPWTARGVFGAIEVASKFRFGRPLAGMRVAVQGVGSVGAELCRLLHFAGARLMVTDVDRAKVSAMVAAYGATAAEPGAIASADVDVFAPCALGASIDRQTVRRMRAGVICGAANNQLASEADGERLAKAGILYAPDFLVNAGGIVSVAGEHLGWSESEVVRRVDAIPDRLRDLLQSAEATGARPAFMAGQAARSIIAAGAPVRSLEPAL